MVAKSGRNVSADLLISVVIMFSSVSRYRLESDIVHVSTYQLVIVVVLHEKGIMSVRGGNFRITDIQFVVEQCLDDIARTLRGKTPVGSKGKYQKIACARAKAALRLPS